MDELVQKAMDIVMESDSAYCKFLSANDSGETGGHQSGILISISARNMFFTEQEIKDNHIIKKNDTIKWQDDFDTNCTFTYYESKGELRITGFGKGFPFHDPVYTGALFVFAKGDNIGNRGFVFNTDDSIEAFLTGFGLTPADTNKPLRIGLTSPLFVEHKDISSFIEECNGLFPSAYDMAKAARNIQKNVSGGRMTDPDSLLIAWTEEEYRLFCAFEESQYGALMARGFPDMDNFVSTANQILNRRKSRAGKSLELHLAAVFDENNISYTAQGITEGNKRPDFLFPSEEAYHDMTFAVEKLCMLAAKTTCKDRWRQILNEANRLRDRNKYLCTLQQGISVAQLNEMEAEKVVLVVPEKYLGTYPGEKRPKIWTLKKFISYIKEIERLP